MKPLRNTHMYYTSRAEHIQRTALYVFTSAAFSSQSEMLLHS